MWQEERHRRIRDQLAAHGQVSVDKIVADFGVSRETVRRDLMEMEMAQQLRRVRGGAVTLMREDTNFQIRITLRLQEKRAIAAQALKLLKNGMTIFMDAGSTSTIMAEVLAGQNALTDLTVITNSVEVAALLTATSGMPSRGVEVMMLAGTFKSDPQETFGAATINDVYRHRADVALLAPWGIDVKSGAMNYFLHGAEIARAMIHNAEKTIILADHSKVGAPARSVFCGVEGIDHLIVNAEARSRPGFDALAAAIPGLIVCD
jgi:DeoR family fructose operon transcriptional repressor